MPKKPYKKFDGIKFRWKDGEIYFTDKYNKLYEESIKHGIKIIRDNNLDVVKILRNFNYTFEISNEYITAKMSFYALQSYGVFLPIREDELFSLAAILLGKSANDRERATGNEFSIEEYSSNWI